MRMLIMSGSESEARPNSNLSVTCACVPGQNNLPLIACVFWRVDVKMHSILRSPPMVRLMPAVRGA